MHSSLLREAGTAIALVWALTAVMSGGAAHGQAGLAGERMLLFERVVDGRVQLLVASERGDEVSPLIVSDGDDTQPDWSPDGEFIAFTRSTPDDRRLYRARADGTGAEPISPPELSLNIYYPTWDPLGRQVAVTVEHDLHLFSADGGNSRQVTATPESEIDFSWAPDGSAIAAQQVVHTEPGQSRLVVIDPATGGVRALSGFDDVGSPAWSPAGDRIAYDADGMVRTVPASGGPTATFGPGRFGVAWSPDGRWLAFGNGAELVVADAATGERRVVARDLPGEVEEQQWSSDGDRIAFRAGDVLSTIAVDGSDLVQVAEGGIPDHPRYAPGPVLRVAGSDRVATSVAVSQRRFSAASTAVVARADDYADALSAAPLAHAEDAPLLLTTGDRLHEAVAAEVRRLGATTAYLMGGVAALSDQVERDLRAAGVDVVERLDGRNRFDTARAVAERLGAPDGVYVVEGAHADPRRGWPDAVAVAGLAAAQGRPLLLVEHGRLPEETRAAARTLDPAGATIVGGDAAVSEEVAAALEAEGVAVDRVAGGERYATSALLADLAMEAGLSAAEVWLATGDDWPDALAAGPAAAAGGNLLLLVDATTLGDSAATRDWLAAHDDIRRVYVTGGPDVLTAGVAAEVRHLLGPQPPARIGCRLSVHSARAGALARSVERRSVGRDDR